MQGTLAQNALAAQLVQQCRRGFTSEFHWMGWRRKWAKQIEALPLDLRNRIIMAWDNAGPKGL
jgi:hypothetical protein